MILKIHLALIEKLKFVTLYFIFKQEANQYNVLSTLTLKNNIKWHFSCLFNFIWELFF